MTPTDKEDCIFCSIEETEPTVIKIDMEKDYPICEEHLKRHNK